MRIKEVIQSFSQLFSQFGLPLHPETLRLCKFNDPKALLDIHAFLIDVTNFISKNTRSNPSETNTSGDLFEIAKFIGFPYWNSLATSSYACLLLLVWYIEKIQLLSLLDEVIYKKLRSTLNGCTNVSSHVNGCTNVSSNVNIENQSNDLYETTQKHYFQKMKLQRLLRELSITMIQENISADSGNVEGLKIPSSDLSGATSLDIHAKNNNEMTIHMTEIDDIIIKSEALSMFYCHFSVFIKWVTSVDYGLEKVAPSLETELLTSIIDLQAQIDVSIQEKDDFNFGNYLFVRCNKGKQSNIATKIQSLDVALLKVEEKIAKQKAILLDLVQDENFCAD